MCAGYFIHQCSLPILHKAEHPEKNSRNVFLGYLMVFFCYCLVGTFGYFAFAGSNFEKVFSSRNPNDGVIGENFLNMFLYDEVPAIVVRCMIYVQLSCSYPLVNHF